MLSFPLLLFAMPNPGPRVLSSFPHRPRFSFSHMSCSRLLSPSYLAPCCNSRSQSKSSRLCLVRRCLRSRTSPSLLVLKFPSSGQRCMCLFPYWYTFLLHLISAIERQLPFYLIFIIVFPWCPRVLSSFRASLSRLIHVVAYHSPALF